MSAAVIGDGPIPMSFPAILRVTDRYTHLRTNVNSSTPVVVKKHRRDENEGKRWIRRKENARFVGNAHIASPTKRDYNVGPTSVRTTFPQPLPPYLPRSSAVPPITPATRDPESANAGRFSLSLKGMRRELRKSGPRTEQLVYDVENAVMSWLRDGGVLLHPDDAAVNALSLPGTPVGNSGSIREVSRTPLQLVWSITDDAFARYVVHCCARYHEIVSFSKDTNGQRCTYLIRPNVTRPDFRAPNALDTPPTTDRESSAYEFDTESDIHSDSDLELAAQAGTLAIVAEQPDVSVFSSPVLAPRAPDADDWLLVGGSEADESGSEHEREAITQGIYSLSLHDSNQTPRADLRVRALRPNVWDRQRRSASSPSRSPVRRAPPRRYARVDSIDMAQSSPRSFYDYLFS